MNKVKFTVDIKYSIKQSLILFLLFLSSMNLFAKSFYFVFAAFIVLLLLGKKIRVNFDVLLLLMFSLTYAVFAGLYNNVLSFLRVFAMPLCYLLGINYFENRDWNSTDNNLVDRKTVTAICIPAMGAFAHYCINYLTNSQSAYRNTIDIWTGESLSATGQACLAIIAVGVFLYISFEKHNMIYKILSVIGLIIILLYNLVLGGRALLLILSTEFVIAFIWSLIHSKNNNKKVKLTLLLLVIFIAFALVYSFDIYGLRTMILGSNLSQRFETSSFLSDSRIYFKLEYLKHMLEYPFGGGHIFNAVGQYAHELYLDVYSDAGIIPFILVLIFIIVSVIRIILYSKTESIPAETRLLMLLSNVSILITFWMEPIMVGMPWMFCIFCFYQGILCSSKKIANDAV
ncbi:MAG: hypothetical protein IJE19_06430 [Clostridia bacterium]|nr:hypothetical protein [Clostridia bacterium]